MVTNMTIPAPGIRLFNSAVMHRYVDEYILKIVWWMSHVFISRTASVALISGRASPVGWDDLCTLTSAFKSYKRLSHMW